MLPDGVLSTTPIPGSFQWSNVRDLSTDLVAYEGGGIALNDPSQGLQFQKWTGRLEGSDIVLEAPTVMPTVVYSGAEITELSLAFDQNMRPCVAFVERDQAKLQWYDTTLSQQVLTELDPAVKNPRVTMDDKRALESGTSDIILAYIKYNCLCYRQQRDRFTIEYQLTGPLYKKLIKIGMNNHLRLQFVLTTI